MARQESRAVMGYLPIEAHHHAAILSLVAPATPKHRILDPTAGYGEFIAAAEAAWNVTAYANELDHDRAAGCIAKLGNRALQGDAERLIASNNAFALGWFNPPYDHDKTETGESKRLEFVHLKHAWKWVQPGGIAMWCIYRFHLTDMAIAFLAKNSHRVDVWALSGKHQGEYDQIVVVAIKGAHANPDALYESIRQQRDQPRLLTVQTEPVYKLPPPSQVSRFTFAPDVVDADTGHRYISADGSWKDPRFQAFLKPDSQTEQIIESVIPPRPGHTTIVLAAGFADGAIIDSQQYGTIALRGKTTHVEEVARVEEIETGDPDHPTVRVTKRLKPKSKVSLLSACGTVVELNDDEAMINFITSHQSSLTQQIAERFQPQYRFDLNGIGSFLDSIRLNHKYPLYTAQKHVIAAITKGFERRDGILLVGQMGTGKTALGSCATIALARGIARATRRTVRDDQITLIVCPPHLTHKWEREAQSISKRCYIAHLKRHEDVKAFMAKAAKLGPGIAKIGIIKREMTKLGSGYEPAVVWRTVHHARWSHLQPTPPGYEPHQRIIRGTVPHCPHCGTSIQEKDDGEGVKYASKEWLRKSKRTCDTCFSPLWQDVREDSTKPAPGMIFPRGNPRYRLDLYLKRFYRNRIGLLIWDEVHEAQHSDTGNGQAFGRIAGIARKVLAMTGTPFNGYSSSLFNLEYALNPRIRQRYPWGGAPRITRKDRAWRNDQTALEHNSKQRGQAESAWVDDMGVREGGEDTVPQYDKDTGAFTGTQTYDRPYVEAPGIAPQAVAEMLDHTIFFSLRDIAGGLPDFEEVPYPVDLDDDVLAEYTKTKDKLRDYLISQRLEGDSTFRGAYFHWCMDWVNTAFMPYEIIHNRRDRFTKAIDPYSVRTLESFGTDRIYAKEQALIDLVRAELDQDRPCIIFCRQTDKRDIQERLATLLRDNLPLAKPFVLRATVPPDRREALIEKVVGQGHNIIIANPEIVKTGLDLVFAGTLIFFEPVFNLGTMMQAAGRNFRLNQKRHKLCRVIYMYANDTMEATAIHLMSRKQRGAKILMGEVGLTGLEALSEGEGGLEEALLNSLTSDDTIIDPSMLFKQDAAANTIDHDDLQFWNVALAATPAEPVAHELAVDMLIAAAAPLGAVVTSLPAAGPAVEHTPAALTPLDAIRHTLAADEIHVAALHQLFKDNQQDFDIPLLVKDFRLYLIRNHLCDREQAASKVAAFLNLLYNEPATPPAKPKLPHGATSKDTRKHVQRRARSLDAPLRPEVERYQARIEQRTHAPATKDSGSYEQLKFIF